MKRKSNQLTKPKWLTNSLRNPKTKRNKSHKKWKSNPKNPDYMASFKIQRKNFENAYKKSRKSYYADNFKYHLLKEIKGRITRSKKIPILFSCYEANQSPSLGDVAEKFNQYFVNVPNNIRQSINDVPPIPISDNDKSLYLYPVSTFEVEELIDSLAHKASSGDDGLSNIVIKLSAPVTVCFMKHIFNCSIFHDFYPESLKNAKILPLHKEGSKLEENNYRPISLLNVVSKIFERAMYTRLYNFFQRFGLLSPCQLGLSNKHSTIDALVELKIRKKWNVKNVSCILDLRKAFDTHDHTTLLYK